MTKLLVIDNYDSFTYNLVHLIGALDNVEMEVVRNDKITIDEIEKMSPDAIVISPGPKTPTEAGICVPMVERFKAEIQCLGFAWAINQSVRPLVQMWCVLQL